MTAVGSRSVVVTGVARRGQLGEAVAAAFVRDRATVSIVARRLADAEARAAELRRLGGPVHAFACDLADPGAATTLARDILAATGRVDVLVNLAGGFAFTGPVADSDPGDYATQYAINVATAYAATRAFLPALRAVSGAVVFAASASAVPGARVRGVSAYVMAKSAVVSLMRAVAQEERPHGVRANAIAPGTIRTASNVAAMPHDTRFIDREAVAAAILFLASPAAAAVTGEVVELSS
ncbi:MAG: SDR family NAD(P)-dependent oxidoreductase [Gemmatimonadota bacterium]|nr:SDR family NAD(P)-dependent oxidoreductase [Gemmatimonadota bacterium]